MGNEDTQALRDEYLALLIALELTVTVHMYHGNCYQRGRVIGFDENSISFRIGRIPKVYQREKISAIAPYKAPNWYNGTMTWENQDIG